MAVDVSVDVPVVAPLGPNSVAVGQSVEGVDYT